MDKLTQKYICIILLVIISAGITAWSKSRPPIILKDVQSKTLPKDAGDWTTPAEGESKIEKEILDSWMVKDGDFIYKRYYRDLDNDGEMTIIDDVVDLMLVYKGNERRGWHVSEMCFSGSGFNVEQSTTTIPYAGNKNAPAVKLVANDPTTGQKTVALYWFANGTHSQSNFWKQQGLMALTRLYAPKDGWAFIRVTAIVKFSEKDTTDMLNEFISDTSDDLVARISSKR